MSPRARVAAFGVCGALVAAGVACAVFVAGTLGQVLAFILIAGGLATATSLVFLEVGLSEDRELERERRRTKRSVAPKHSDGSSRLTARALGRRRSHARRLR